MQAAAVILAAGASTRFGSPKQLALIDSRRMLDIVAATAAAAGLRPVLAVVPPKLDVPDDVVPVINDRPQEGISRSIRLGLAAVPVEVGAAVILLGDEPLLTIAAISDVVAAAADGAGIVATRAGDRLGPPVLMRRDRFTLADAAHGDEGLGTLLKGEAGIVEVDAQQEPVDIDTPADLERMARARSPDR